MSKDVIIIGAGGHAKVIADIIYKSGDNLIGFLDDNLANIGKEIYLGKKVLGTTKDIENYNKNYFGSCFKKKKLNNNRYSLLLKIVIQSFILLLHKKYDKLSIFYRKKY